MLLQLQNEYTIFIECNSYKIKFNLLNHTIQWFFNSWVGKIHWRRNSYPLQYSWASLVAQLVKNLPAMRETWVWSLGWEDPPEKGKATHSVFWPGEFQGVAKSWTQLNDFHFHLAYHKVAQVKLQSNIRTVSLPQRKSVPISSHSSPALFPRPLQLLIYFVFVNFTIHFI